jgi:putative addiction module killer protein
MDYGPGYRIYFYRDGMTRVLLLCGGGKKSQPQDIKEAKKYLKDYKRRKHDA